MLIYLQDVILGEYINWNEHPVVFHVIDSNMF